MNRIKKRKEAQVASAQRGAEYYNENLSNIETRMNGLCRFINQSPYNDRISIGKAYLRILDATNDYLVVQTPQLLDTKYESFSKRPLIEKFDQFEMYNKLFDKLLFLSEERGIKTDLITSGPEIGGNENTIILHEEIKEHLKNGQDKKAQRKLKSIKFWNEFFGRPHYENLINDYIDRKNTKVWTHISYLHSKIFYFDRIISSIGSYNFQHNATDHSYENTLICQDKELNKQLDEVLVRDMANSVPLIFKGISR